MRAQAISHHRSVLADEGQQQRPFTSGELHVLRVRRVVMNKNAGIFGRPDDLHSARASVIMLSGVPASKRSSAKSALLTFMRPGVELPRPAFDPETGRIDLYYPMADLKEVTNLLLADRDRLCYFWQADDRSRALAWLIAVP